MCRWIAYAGRPVPLERFLFDPDYSLVDQSLRARQGHTPVNGDGFGVGWYGRHRESGVYRDVRPAWGDENLKSIAHHVDSGLFLAHVRASTGTATTRSNCHPFAHGQLLFMHNGQIGGYEQVRRPLENLLPDSLYAARRGSTDSEVLFLLLAHFGVEHDPCAAFARLIEVVDTQCDRAGLTEPFRFTCALADGVRVVVLRYASDPHPPSVYFRCDANGCIVVSEPLDDRIESWDGLAPSQMLTVCPGEVPRIDSLS